MAAPKNKLPKSVLVLNVIMIIIVIVICGLLISLLYGDQLKAEDTPTIEITAGQTQEADFQTGEAVSTQATTTTTKATSSVSMTKRTTEPTEPVDEPVVPDETEEAVVEVFNSKEFYKDDLFIGDSIGTGLHIYGKLEMKNVAADTGLTPYKAYTNEISMYDGTKKTALDYAEKMQPKRIFIMLGSNALAAEAELEDSYRTLVDKLNVACPKSKIYCISVTPLTQGSSYHSESGLNNDKVKQFNSFLKGFCSENGIRFIDFYSEVVGEDGYFMKEYAEVDGMHFKSITYDLLLKTIHDDIS